MGLGKLPSDRPLLSLPFALCSKAVESLTEGGGSEVQRVKEDARRKVQQVEDLLMERIHLLEEVSLEMPRGLYLQVSLGEGHLSVAVTGCLLGLASL